MTVEDGTAVPPALDVDTLRIRHQDRQAWTPDGVTFSVARGEVVLVLGPSGSGKSTLALALDGLVPHVVAADVEGSVRVAGLDTRLHPVAELSERVAMVFQDPDAQIVTGSVLDEVCFAAENRLVPVDAVLAGAESALRRVGLWERRDEDPDVLSGGGKQRLAIAAALASSSDVLVLDEPTANLDAAGLDDVYAALSEIVADGSRSVVLIEHNLDAAVSLVDRVVVLDHRGASVLDGPPSVVFGDRAADLERLGVWLPTATIVALRLKRAGISFDRLPVTSGDLAATLDAVPGLPSPSARADLALVSSAPPAIVVRSLTIARGRGRRRRTVVDGIDLTVGSGEFLSIVGTNGAGKTTLVHAIAGLIRPPRGTITVGGLDPATASAPAISERIGFVFQNPEHQFVTHTVFDELAHGPRSNGADEAAIRSRVDELLDRFGLSDSRDVNPFLLSGGQKRRLSVGTALIGGADILILDEPTFGQDRARADELVSILADLHRAGTTIVVVTHDMQLVAEASTSIAVLDDGRLLAHRPADAVLTDDDLLARAGLRTPPLRRALRGLERHPDWRGVTRMSQVPGGDGS
ncbi:energy-coupling factor transport system ATP-binding protein [Labedella gwakjiensis]|uniref:Energy-coupling factor ABC transporter ATP-binding protein n=1 Tax=Labedella gwakjiensis TaxID=390269 RepID=A0A2P8GSH8_9MICO|nr:ABC transporter ATP-binding protein [Labedella gwakjiensis]PSL36914.1 energy-coupling factor transport system ATP-binding protein [Labedella gwakjiensis]RUQ84405.1 energy-coupling factor ABC transporter ATP-binding protein [Labedella gwakjiensis]